MKDLIKKMIQESVWQQITKDFHKFTMEHCEKLSLKEQLVFVNLLNANDEYSFAVLQKLWEQFEAKGGCSKERIQELFDIEVKKMGSISI
jgi:hypothetical protein